MYKLPLFFFFIVWVVLILAYYSYRFYGVNKKQKNFKVFNVSMIIFSVLILTTSLIIIDLLCDKYFFLQSQMQDSDKRSLLNTIWQIQGTITALSVSFVAILIGINKEKIYGVEVLKFISIRKTFFNLRVNFWDEVVISFLLIICMYYFVISNRLIGGMLLFTLNIFIIIRMVSNTLVILVAPDNLKGKIKSQLLNESREEIILENIQNESR